MKIHLKKNLGTFTIYMHLTISAIFLNNRLWRVLKQEIFKIYCSMHTPDFYWLSLYLSMLYMIDFF